MTDTPAREPWIVDQLRAFYAEVLELQSYARTGHSDLISGRRGRQSSPGQPPATPAAASMPAPRPYDWSGAPVTPAAGAGAGIGADSATAIPPSRAAAISRRLMDTLVRLESDAGRLAGFAGAQLFEDAKYAMVALADEMLVEVDWPERLQWIHNPLELQLYGTQMAGDELFRRIDRRLAADDPKNREMGLVYLVVLALGFRGRFRNGQRDDDRLATYRRDLFAHVYHRKPAQSGLDEGRALTPSAYESLATDTHPRQMPYLAPWIAAAGAVFVIWLISTWTVWLINVGDLRGALSTITTMAE